MPPSSPKPLSLSSEEEKLILRFRQLQKGEFQFVTLDLEHMAIVKKWSDRVEPLRKPATAGA